MFDLEDLQKEDIILTVQIRPYYKDIYISKENTSGCDYEYKNAEEIGKIFAEYLKNYENIK